MRSEYQVRRQALGDAARNLRAFLPRLPGGALQTAQGWLRSVLEGGSDLVAEPDYVSGWPHGAELAPLMGAVLHAWAEVRDAWRSLRPEERAGQIPPPDEGPARRPRPPII